MRKNRVHGVFNQNGLQVGKSIALPILSWNKGIWFIIGSLVLQNLCIEFEVAVLYKKGYFIDSVIKTRYEDCTKV